LASRESVSDVGQEMEKTQINCDMCDEARFLTIIIIGRNGQEIDIDMGIKCFKEKLVPFLQENNINIVEKDWVVK